MPEDRLERTRKAYEPEEKWEVAREYVGTDGRKHVKLKRVIPEGCYISPPASRVCERGTKSCIVHHACGAPPELSEPTESIDNLPSPA